MHQRSVMESIRIVWFHMKTTCDLKLYCWSLYRQDHVWLGREKHVPVLSVFLKHDTLFKNESFFFLTLLLNWDMKMYDPTLEGKKVVSQLTNTDGVHAHLGRCCCTTKQMSRWFFTSDVQKHIDHLFLHCCSVPVGEGATALHVSPCHSPGGVCTTLSPNQLCDKAALVTSHFYQCMFVYWWCSPCVDLTQMSSKPILPSLIRTAAVSNGPQLFRQ